MLPNFISFPHVQRHGTATFNKRCDLFRRKMVNFTKHILVCVSTLYVGDIQSRWCPTATFLSLQLFHITMAVKKLLKTRQLRHPIPHFSPAKQRPPSSLNPQNAYIQITTGHKLLYAFICKSSMFSPPSQSFSELEHFNHMPPH